MRQVRTRTNWLVIVMVGLALAVGVGCAKKVPQEVTDVNRSLGQAKDACASVYAADDLGAVQQDADSMNAWVEKKKMKKAKKEAIPLQPRVDALISDSEQAKADAEKQASQAIQSAEAALGRAGTANAPKLAANDFNAAQAKLRDAKNAAADPCRYAEATRLANEAAALGQKAHTAAIAEQKRLDEEARRAEEARLAREEEERRRRAEAERLAKYPPTYTVEKGDSLWKITSMEKIYGAGKYWPIVHDANSGAIVDPDLIYPGQVLTIPRDINNAEMDSKLSKLWGRYAADVE